jgi:hypothetical protein
MIIDNIYNLIIQVNENINIKYLVNELLNKRKIIKKVREHQDQVEDVVTDLSDNVISSL